MLIVPLATASDVGVDIGSIDITHHFAGNVYAKEMRVPAGVDIVQHRHAYDHLSMLVSGIARVLVDGVATVKTAPCMITIEGGKHHRVSAITDVVWYCIHATAETDATKVDGTLIA